MNQTRREYLKTSAAAAFSLCAEGSAESQQSVDFSAARDLAERYRKKYDVPGLSVAFARNERLVYAAGFGMSDTATSKRVTPASLFRIASVSKPITSITLFKLLEARKFTLADRVFGDGGILGSDFGGPPYKTGVDAITMEHLMTHTAGGWQNDGNDPMFHHTEMNHHDLISWTIANQPLKNTPGENFAYSNFGYCILGRVVEKLTGLPYAEAVQNLVLTPCGVSAMKIAGNTEEQRVPGEVTYYDANSGSPYGMQVTRMDSHGGWLATPTDLVKILTRVDGFPDRRDILKTSTIKTMITPSEPSHGGYAHGWSVNKDNNYWHNGSLPGTASIAVRTARDYCWAAITNVRRPGTNMEGDLDKLMWNMMSSVQIWPDVDLFSK